ncbi:MAG: glucosaminidase domain-containing protein [Bacteroidota bacterium]
MQRTGVPASIKLAQGIHETTAGTSLLVVKSNNHFGIKCKDTWKGQSVTHDDDLRGECFRKYSSPDISYRDHSDFLKNSQRYAQLFRLDPAGLCRLGPMVLKKRVTLLIPGIRKLSLS